MKELIKTYTQDEDTYTVDHYELLLDGQVIGTAEVTVSDTAYVERIDIEEAYRNQGHGTEMLKELSEIYGSIYLAPDNEDAARLYERIGYEYTGADADYIDQGYGVYEI